MNDVIEPWWAAARASLPDLPEDPPGAWAFGATADHADELLSLVLAGVKTGTAMSLRECELTGEAIPRAGDYSIILDGSGRPAAIIQTTRIDIVPFGDVDADHAHAEGEDDRTLSAWRDIHERYWRTYSPAGFACDMPVVCERFTLIHPAPETAEVHP